MDQRDAHIAALRRLNFETLIGIEHDDVTEYSVDDYLANDTLLPRVTSFCTACEEKDAQDTRNWSNDGVRFVYESPSIDYKDSKERPLYREVRGGTHVKRPTQQWYWIHHEWESGEFPYGFRGRAYTELILGTIKTFQLANVYITNLVKCGMNSEAGDRFKPIGSFQGECVSTCYESFLRREIELMQPKVIFGVGSYVNWWLAELLEEGPIVQGLPHPAARGLKDEHFRTLYFWLILKTLIKGGVVGEDRLSDFADIFISKFDNADPS